MSASARRGATASLSESSGARCVARKGTAEVESAVATTEAGSLRQARGSTAGPLLVLARRPWFGAGHEARIADAPAGRGLTRLDGTAAATALASALCFRTAAAVELTGVTGNLGCGKAASARRRAGGGRLRRGGDPGGQECEGEEPAADASRVHGSRKPRSPAEPQGRDWRAMLIRAKGPCRNPLDKPDHNEVRDGPASQGTDCGEPPSSQASLMKAWYQTE